jgi:adenylosuccinate synthase
MLPPDSRPSRPSLSFREYRFLYPWEGVQDDYDRIYKENIIVVGPDGKEKSFNSRARPNSRAVVGGALGDEGKGRIVDNTIEGYLGNKKAKLVYVVRFNGAANSGHTLEEPSQNGEKGRKASVHQIPSIIFYKKEVIGIMDQGEAVNIEDLMVEDEYLRRMGVDISGRLFCSEKAIWDTDISRAREVFEEIIAGKKLGGTHRGVGPDYSDFYARNSIHICDFLGRNWKERVGSKYDRFEKFFRAFGVELSEINVPDFRRIKLGRIGTAERPVGAKGEFLARLEVARAWLLDQQMVIDTFRRHQEIFVDDEVGVIFEGAQAIGLHPWLGTRDDVTSSDPSAYGISSGTGFWLAENMEEITAVIKGPYTSSVGARVMLTQIPLSKDIRGLSELPTCATYEQKYASYVREEAGEYGTSTGRPRDICWPDLTFIGYNLRMAKADTLVVTHMDIAREDFPIAVCTHYIDASGKKMIYQPWLRSQQNLRPVYICLPGWDGEACREAKSFKELPLRAKQYLAFLQARTGVPVTAITTGASRENFIQL